jgi:hypothetical protein
MKNAIAGDCDRLGGERLRSDHHVEVAHEGTRVLDSRA